jgi:predicted acyltransferase
MQSPGINSNRLLSLDVMRGIIMVLLMLESVRLYDNLFELTENTALAGFFMQFFHHPWHGLRFWDLIQPGFMFMAGTALAYSLHRQQLEGWSWQRSFIKTLKRSGWLFFWGVLDYAVRPGGLSFELWDVLTQLSFTTLVAFLIFRWSAGAQISFSLLLLLLTEILYRFTDVPGFDQPFTDQQNFGNYVDVLLMNKINKGGWVAINCLPTAAHTIWGVLAGKLLLSDQQQAKKVNILLIAGATALAAGFILDVTVTPIIKRIATSSFVLASAGWVLWTLAILYWWIDVKGHRNRWTFFVIVGMNSLFIYLFIEIVGSRWFTGYITAISNGLLEIIQMPGLVITIVTPLVVFSLEWLLCWFLYKKRIFFKL